MRVKLPGVNRVRRRLADGSVRVYHYHRATGTPLPGKPGSPEFQAAYIEAGQGAAVKRSTGTVEWLIRSYRQSRAFAKLAASTREIAEFNMKACEAKWGSTPTAIVENPKSRPAFLRWHEMMALTYPRAADAKMAALSRIFAWGIDQGHIRHNPIASFERAYRSDRADLIWLPEHVAAFQAVAAPELDLALMLALHSGQRQGDLLTLPWSAWDGSAITLRQGKTRQQGGLGRLVYVPATRALRQALEAAPRRATTILVTPAGLPWAKRAFHTAWSGAFAKAGIAEDLHFHDLRGTAVTMLAEAGCSVPEIATITGHSQAHAQKILDRYLARTKTLAESAIAKLDEHRRNRDLQNGFAKRIENEV